MAKIKSALEKAMEKAAEIGVLSPEEKERLKDQEDIKALLADFFKGQIDRDGLWQKLKGSRASLLKEAQLSLIDSIGLSSTKEEFQKRKDGILAIETLKDKQNISPIELILDSLALFQKEYQEGKENAIQQLREAVERNPQYRLQPVRTPDGRTVLQAAPSVDEAVQARLSEFLLEHEEHFSMTFNRTIAKLKNEIR